jgi:DNA-directed RNA polymerase specialized sigma24 family protein
MPKRNNKTNAGDESLPSAEKIARLLGLQAIKEIENKNDKVIFLRTVGFNVSEIAQILGIVENHVSVAIYQNRKKKTKKRR